MRVSVEAGCLRIKGLGLAVWSLEFWRLFRKESRNSGCLAYDVQTRRQGGLDMLHLLGADHEVRPLCNGLRGRFHT